MTTMHAHEAHAEGSRVSHKRPSGGAPPLPRSTNKMTSGTDGDDCRRPNWLDSSRPPVSDLHPGATLESESVPGSSVPGLRVVLLGSGYCLEFEANERIGFEDFPTINFVDRSVLDQATLDGSEDRLKLDP